MAVLGAVDHALPLSTTLSNPALALLYGFLTKSRRLLPSASRRKPEGRLARRVEYFLRGVRYKPSAHVWIRKKFLSATNTTKAKSRKESEFLRKPLVSWTTSSQIPIFLSPAMRNGSVSPTMRRSEGSNSGLIMDCWRRPLAKDATASSLPKRFSNNGLSVAPYHANEPPSP